MVSRPSRPPGPLTSRSLLRRTRFRIPCLGAPRANSAPEAEARRQGAGRRRRVGYGPGGRPRLCSARREPPGAAVHRRLRAPAGRLGLWLAGGAAVDLHHPLRPGLGAAGRRGSRDRDGTPGPGRGGRSDGRALDAPADADHPSQRGDRRARPRAARHGDRRGGDVGGRRDPRNRLRVGPLVRNARGTPGPARLPARWAEHHRRGDRAARVWSCALRDRRCGHRRLPRDAAVDAGRDRRSHPGPPAPHRRLRPRARAPQVALTRRGDMGPGDRAHPGGDSAEHRRNHRQAPSRR